MSGKRLADEYLLERAFARFKQRFVVDPVTQCWNWTAGKSKRPDGSERGAFTMPREPGSQSASRCSWLFHKGAIPKGRHVLHTCDNSLCVNPDHLYLGDHLQNMRDKKDRKRQWSDRDHKSSTAHLRGLASHPGETNGSAKLTWSDVRLIRASKQKSQELADQYDVHRTLIWQIRTGKIWNEKHA